MKQTAQLLIRAYIELLKVQDNTVRIHLDRTYCTLRDQISTLTGKSEEDIQTTCEQLALQERLLTA